MAITRTPMVDDDGSGTTGTVVNNAWKQELYNQIDAADASVFASAVWQQIPYNAANFLALGGQVWTVEAGDQLGYRYVLFGKTAMISLTVINSAVSGATSYLIAKLPFTVKTDGYGAGLIKNVTTSEIGFVQAQANNAQILIMRSTGLDVGWAAGLVNVQVSCVCEIF